MSKNTSSSSKPLSKAEQEGMEKAKAAAAKGQGTAVTQAAKSSVGQVLNFAADAGAGLEGADKDSFAIPFLVVLQPLSPVVVDKTVPGAEAGMLMNSVTQELYGREAFFVPCAFQRRFVRWQSRKKGGGFKGEMTATAAAEVQARGEVKSLDNRLYFPEADGSVNPETSDKLSDTRNHYGILLHSKDDAFGVPLVMALASTGIKVSKNFLSRIESIKLQRQDGTRYTPPSFSHVYRIGTEQKKNDSGTWFLPVITMMGPVRSEDLYHLGKGFHDRVQSGKVELATDSLGLGDGGGEEEAPGKGF